MAKSDEISDRMVRLLSSLHSQEEEEEEAVKLENRSLDHRVRPVKRIPRTTRKRNYRRSYNIWKRNWY